VCRNANKSANFFVLANFFKCKQKQNQLEYFKLVLVWLGILAT